MNKDVVMADAEAGTPRKKLPTPRTKPKEAEVKKDKDGDVDMAAADRKKAAVKGFSDLYAASKKIGETTCVKVYAGTIVEDGNRYGKKGKNVAIKMTDLAATGNVERAMNYVRWEMKGLQLAGDHPNVLRGYETIIERKKEMAYLVAELCNADLYKATENQLPHACVMAIFKQMVAGLQHIHQKQMCHRDIKLENYFVKYPSTVHLKDITNPDLVNFFTVKLGDFGFWGKSHDDDGSVRLHYSACGSDIYSGPEQAINLLANRDGYDGQLGDIFSLGVSLYMMSAGHPPWTTSRTIDDPYYKLWIRGRVDEYWRVIDNNTPKERRHSNAFKHLMTWMLSINPQKRPSLNEVLNHPFITGVGADKVEFKPTNNCVPEEVTSDIIEGLAAKSKSEKKGK